MDFDYDLFVIGAGSGGVRAARIAAGHGARVAVAEEDRVGGTCVIRGCVPKKLLVLAGRYGEALGSARHFGWSFGEARFDWSELIRSTRSEVSRLESIYQRNLEASGATLMADRAQLLDAHTVQLARSGNTFSARNIIVATGARPVYPSFPGAELAMTSDDVFLWDQLPKSICVLGAGYIAVELAGMFRSLGAEITLVHRGPALLRGFDADLRESLTAAYSNRGIKLRFETTVERIEASGDTRRVHLSDGEVLDCQAVVVAIGRRPNSDRLGLQELGVQIDAFGAVKVDTDSRTSVNHLFAVGDVTNRVTLTPVAVREGHAVADLLFGKAFKQVDSTNVATAVFSTPEVATIGPTEDEALAIYPHLKVFRTSFRPLAEAFLPAPDRVLMKLLVDGDSDRVVAAHLFGPESAELIQLLAVAIRAGVTKADFDSTVAVHPTLAEELVTMRVPYSTTQPETNHVQEAGRHRAAEPARSAAGADLPQ